MPEGQTTKNPNKKSKPILRKYRGDEKIHHDLFRLLLAKTHKNEGYDPIKPQIVMWDHGHFFHTIDSSGRPQRYSSAQAGHIHRIEHGVDEKGNLVITHVGPPLLFISSKRREDYPYDKSGKLNDRHVHKCEYIFSEEVEIRKISEKAQQSIALYANEEANANSASKAVVT